MTARVKQALAALTPAQRGAVTRHLGTADVIAYRLAEARPLVHVTPQGRQGSQTAAPSTTRSTSDGGSVYAPESRAR